MVFNLFETKMSLIGDFESWPMMADESVQRWIEGSMSRWERWLNVNFKILVPISAAMSSNFGIVRGGDFFFGIGLTLHLAKVRDV